MKFHVLPSVIAVLISVVIGLVLGVVSSQKSGDGLNVVANGNLGGPVSITVSGAITAHKQQLTPIKGEGPAIADGKQVLLRVSNFAYTADGFMSTINSGAVRAATASQKELGDLFPLVKGATEGSRVVAIYPDKSKVSAEIVVLDLLPTAVRGKMIQPQGFPQGFSVVEDARGVPTVHAAGTALGASRVAVLVQGNGKQVGANDAIYANYLIADSRGQVRESTFGRPAVAYIEAAKTFPGLNSAIVDQRVGSRVVAAVPAAQGRGDGDIFIILDILAQADKAPVQPATPGTGSGAHQNSVK